MVWAIFIFRWIELLKIECVSTMIIFLNLAFKIKSKVEDAFRI